MKKEYWQQLNEEYSIPLPNKSFEEASEDEIYSWFLEDQKQSKILINKYGKSAWNIHRFMELCRAEDISESFFRQLCRYEMDKCFKLNSAEKRIKDKYNSLNSKLKEETNPKLTKRLNLGRIQELEIQVKLLKELME